MRGLPALSFLAAAALWVGAAPGVAGAPAPTIEPVPSTSLPPAPATVDPPADPTTTVSQPGSPGFPQAVAAIGTDAAAGELLTGPVRGEALQVGPTLPPAPVLPPGEMGDPTLPDSLEVPADSGEGRRIVYSNSLMRIWAIDESGNLVKTHRVSGKTGEPNPGTYTVWSRSFATFASHNPAIRWNYMVRFAWTPRGGNIGFHEIPTECRGSSCWKMQTVEQLGQSLSGGCVRQSTPDAIWVWNWANIGTKVVVLP